MKFSWQIVATLGCAVASTVAIARTPTEAASCSNYETVDTSICSKAEIYAAENKYAEQHTRWHYDETMGKMAVVYASNAFMFGPLADHNYRRATLSVMQGEGYKLVTVSADGLFDPAKLMCTAADCPISVRFDQGLLKTYSTRGGGVSMNLIDPDDFLKNVRISKKVNIVFPLEQYGNVTFEFNVSGYKW